MRLMFSVIPAVLLACSLGCTSASSDGSNSITSGSLVVQFGSDSFPGYSNVVVGVESLEISRDGSSWSSLGSIQKTVDLMGLQNGNPSTLINGLSVPTGTYHYFRVTWATTNYADITSQPAYLVTTSATKGLLAMPKTTVLTGTLTISNQTASIATLMLDGTQAVQAKYNLNATQPYYFQPTGSFVDRAQSAKVTGKITGSASIALSGVEVYAETTNGYGDASICRRALTDANGKYTLDALPTGVAVYIVAQPAGTSVSYPAIAEMTTLSAGGSYALDLGSTSNLSPGSINLTITPASTSSQGTWGELRKSVMIPSAGTSAYLIVRSQTAVSGVSQDQVSFAGVAPGAYSYTSQRSTSGAAPLMKVSSAEAVLASGATLPVTLGY